MYFFTDAVVDAVLTVGSRVLLTPGVIAAPGWDRLGSWEAMRNGISRRIDRDGLRYGPGERVELGYGPHAAYTLPAEALRSVAEHARERGALLHIHVAETLEEDVALRAEHGSVPALLAGPGCSTGGCSRRTASNLRRGHRACCARHAPRSHAPGRTRSSPRASPGSPTCAGPVSGSGWAPTGPHRATTSTCGTRRASPGCWPGCGENDAAALTAADLLLLATRDGAAAIDRDDLGALEPGRWADMVHVDLDDQAFVDPADDAQLLSNLVWAGGARAVRDVWVAGEQVLAEGEPTRVDRAEATRDLREIAARLHA